MAYLADEINSTHGDITGPTAHVEVIFLLKDKECRYWKTFFWDVNE